MDWMDSQELGKTIIGKIGEKYVWMRSTWIAVISPNKQKLWRYLCPALMRIKSYFSRRLIQQSNREGHLFSEQPTSSPAVSVIVQPLGLMRKVNMVAEMEVMHGLNKMSCDHQGWQGYRCWWIPDIPISETSTDPQIRHHFSRWPAGDMMAGWLHWSTSFTEMTTLCSYWYRYLLWLWVCLTARNAYANPTICGLTECHTSHHGIPRKTASDQGIHFTDREGQEWTHNHWTDHAARHPEAAAMI